MKTPITTIPAPDPLQPFDAKDYANLCPDFGQGYDPKDRECVRCHMQLLCLHTYKFSIHPRRIEQIRQELGVTYFLDEARTGDFEDFYAAIVEALLGDGFTDDECRKVVAKNQLDWLQLEDCQFPEIVLQRIKRDPALEIKGGILSWR